MTKSLIAFSRLAMNDDFLLFGYLNLLKKVVFDGLFDQFVEMAIFVTDNPKIYRVCPRIYRLRSKIYRPRPRIYRVRPKIYRVFPHFTDESSTISKEKEQQMEKTMLITPSPHRRQLQLDERFGSYNWCGENKDSRHEATQVSLRPVSAC